MTASGTRATSSSTTIPTTGRATPPTSPSSCRCSCAGRLVGFAANTAHHVDIGAATPGLIIDVPDVFAEGMLFAGTKLYRKGEPNRTMWNFIRRNSRAAGQLVADIEAQVASARLGAKRFVELIEKYGEDMVFGAANQLMDYSERLMRQRIAEIPDGDYVAEGWLDDDGRNRDQRLKVKVTVRVRGRRRGGRPDRLRRPDADRLQRALRGLDQGRGLLRLPQAAARSRHLGRARARRTRARSGR